MLKLVPQADAKSASMGWFFDPGFIQNVQRVAADVENPSMESIDSVLFALREMGYIRTAETCEHGFSVDECVDGMCELQTENAILRARVARLEAALRDILPPEHGEYGGPLVEMVARYEDGSPTERITPLLAKMHIGHEAVARARRALEEK